jgi:hypothetical protein
MMKTKKVLVSINIDLYNRLKIDALKDKRSTTNYIEVKIQEMYPDCQIPEIF